MISKVSKNRTVKKRVCFSWLYSVCNCVL